MKQMQLFFFVTLCVILFAGMSSCGSSGSEHGHAHDHDALEAQHTEIHNAQGKEYTSAYVCPMHCEGSGSDSVGTCPVCGMDYVKLEDHIHQGHDQ